MASVRNVTELSFFLDGPTGAVHGMNESSVTQHRKKRRLGDAADETAMTHGVGVDAESRCWRGSGTKVQ